MPTQYLSIKDVADLFNVSYHLINQECKRGRLPYMLFGNQKRISTLALNEFVKNKEVTFATKKKHYRREEC